MTVNDKHITIDSITETIIDRADRNPAALEKHMLLFKWGYMAKHHGKEKRFEREVHDLVIEYLNGRNSDVMPLDAYLRALGIDGYEIMMKIKDYKKRPN